MFDLLGIDKSKRLIEYLKRLSSLRENIVRNLEHEEYVAVLWLSDIPQKKGCYCATWGKEEKRENGVWIEMQSSAEPKLPKYPDICEDWVQKELLRNTKTIPQLKDKIQKVEKFQKLDGTKEYIVRKMDLEDYTYVKDQWQSYLELSWLPWARQYEEWEIVHLVYAQLFAIYQDLLKEGEKYELILAQGLLKWKKKENYKVRRHLIVSNATIEFDRVKKKFIVKSNESGVNIRPEFDMLDMEDVPPKSHDVVAKELNETEDDPFDKDVIESVLKSIVHSIGLKTAGGEYFSNLKENEVFYPDKPIIEYAPALILRKRSSKGLAVVLNKILEQMDSNSSLGEFGQLAEIELLSKGGIFSANDKKIDENVEIYFPKRANEEQIRIVKNLAVSKGILVQGPPGTGKSHTISNLICHLLATGNRILVTAKTSRALQVLSGDKGLVSKEIKPLCINMLGEGNEEYKSLESSIKGIFQQQDTWQEDLQKAKQIKLEDSLHVLRSDRAEKLNRLRAIREKEAHQQSILDGKYKGTASQIAKRINDESEKYGWLTDCVMYDQHYPFSEINFEKLISFLRNYPKEMQEELRLILPQMSSLPNSESVKRIINLEQENINKRAQLDIKDETYKRFNKIDKNRARMLHDKVSEVLNEIKAIKRNPHDWGQKAMIEVFSGNDYIWFEIFKTITEVLKNIDSIAVKADEVNISLPKRVDEKRVLKDAQSLLIYMKKGGSLGWGPFRSKFVKERKYLFKEVTIDGFLCSDQSKISELIDVLTVRHNLEKAWELTKGRIDKEEGNYGIQKRILEKIHETIEKILTTEKKISHIDNQILIPNDLKIPLWCDETNVSNYMKELEYFLLMIEAEEIKLQLEEFVSEASKYLKTNSHPVVKLLATSLQTRNIEEYEKCLVNIEKLVEDKSNIEWIEETIKKVKEKAPKLVEKFDGNFIAEAKHLLLSDAWCWAQAKNWIEEYLKKDDEESLSISLEQIENKIGEAFVLISEIKAWSFCLSRMKNEHRQHMESWSQAMKRMGKGTGKHALRHKKDAQNHMNECKDAVPAWVMPLHRVWDTVDPVCGAFDVVIIDEASQCGYEALPLLYLGKKIVIVGDDKQISPEGGFVDGDLIRRQMDELLFDFEHKDSFNNETSLFDHGKRIYHTNRVTLREHFRCMPEIIQFSNDLCYSDTPLLPLRQYPPNRLVPKMHVYVGNGYREGSDSKIINKNEAEEIVKKVVELCEDPKYKEKTMGIIVLQGHAQAKIIEDLLLKSLDVDEIKERRIICGNPYSFQGDERDIIFLSMVVAPNDKTRITALAKKEDERRYNVAVSRAKDQIWLFHSVKTEDLSPSDLRRRLLEYFEEKIREEISGVPVEKIKQISILSDRQIVNAPSPFDSWFEVDVCLEIVEKGYKVIPQFKVAGYFIDLVVEGGDKRLAVECDGDNFHDVEQYEKDMDRQRKLERLDWKFFRIRASSFYSNKNKALEKLWLLLEERSIYPLIPKLENKPELSIKEEISSDVITFEDDFIKIGDHVTFYFEDAPAKRSTVIVKNDKTPLMNSLIDSMIGEKINLSDKGGSDRIIIVEGIIRS